MLMISFQKLILRQCQNQPNAGSEWSLFTSNLSTLKLYKHHFLSAGSYPEFPNIMKNNKLQKL